MKPLQIALLAITLAVLPTSSFVASAQKPQPVSLLSAYPDAYTDFICRYDWDDELTEYSCWDDAAAGTRPIYAIVACPYVGLDGAIAGCYRLDLTTWWWRRLR